jgi:tetratricopeptide (TPR) repeat protein
MTFFKILFILLYLLLIAGTVFDIIKTLLSLESKNSHHDLRNSVKIFPLLVEIILLILFIIFCFPFIEINSLKFYRFIIILSLYLLSDWTFWWLTIKHSILKLESKENEDRETESKELEVVSKKYDIQFKRLAKYVFFLFFLYVIYGTIEFQENNNGFLISQISTSKTFENTGYNETTLLNNLLELKEEIIQKTSRIVMERVAQNPLPQTTKEELPLTIQVQGFGLPLKKIGSYIGEKLFEDKKKYINISFTEDSVEYKSLVFITGKPIQVFEELFENSFDREFALQKLLSRIEYYVLEVTNPFEICDYYSSLNWPDECLRVLKYSKDSNSYMNQYYIARTYYDMRLYDSALFYGNKCGKIDQKKTNHINILGLTEMAMNNPNRAISNFRYANLLDSNDYYPIYNLARYMESKGKIDSAIYYYKKCNSMDSKWNSNKIYSLIDLSLCYKEKHDYNKANKCIVDACNLDSKSYEILNNYFPLFNSGASLDSMNKSIKKKKDEIYLPYQIYYLSKYNSNTSNRIMNDNYEALLKKYNDCNFLKLLYANSLLYDNQKEKAVVLINSVLSIDDLNYWAYFLKGEYYRLYKNESQAEKFFKKALNLNPSCTDAFWGLNSIFNLTGRETELLRYSTTFLQTSPFDPIANRVIGIKYFNQGNYFASVTYLLKSLEDKRNLDGQSGNSLVCLVLSYIRLHDVQDALNYVNILVHSKYNLKLDTHYQEIARFMYVYGNNIEKEKGKVYGTIVPLD